MSDVSNEKLDELENLAKAVREAAFHGRTKAGAIPYGLIRSALDDELSAPTVLALIAELRRRRSEGC